MPTFGVVPKWFEIAHDGWLLEPGGRDRAYSAIRAAGIGSGKLARMRVETFDTERDPKAYDLAMKWLERHLAESHPKDGGWLFLQGRNGRGKTHLAVALLHLLTWASPVLHWRRTEAAGLYLPWAEVTAGYESWERVGQLATETQFLVIDDLTKRRVTPWSLEVLYEVVDARDRDDLTTIFTSNTALADLFTWYVEQADRRDRELASQASLAIIGRIQQRVRHTGGAWIVSMTGQDYRTR